MPRLPKAALAQSSPRQAWDRPVHGTHTRTQNTRTVETGDAELELPSVVINGWVRQRLSPCTSSSSLPIRICAAQVRAVQAAQQMTLLLSDGEEAFSRRLKQRLHASMDFLRSRRLHSHAFLCLMSRPSCAASSVPLSPPALPPFHITSPAPRRYV